MPWMPYTPVYALPAWGLEGGTTTIGEGDGWMGVREETSAKSESGFSAIAAKNTSSSEIWEGLREGSCVTCCLLVRSETRLVS